MSKKLIHIIPGGDLTGCDLRVTRKIRGLFEEFRDPKISCPDCLLWEQLDSAQNFAREAIEYLGLRDIPEIESVLLSLCAGGLGATPFCEYNLERDMSFEFEGVLEGALQIPSAHASLPVEKTEGRHSPD